MNLKRLNSLLNEIADLDENTVKDYPTEYAYLLADWLYENLPRPIFNVLAGDLEPQPEDETEN